MLMKFVYILNKIYRFYLMSACLFCSR